MNRRGFLGSILAAAAAPAIVRADSLMRILPRDALVLPIDDLRSAFEEGFQEVHGDTIIYRRYLPYAPRPIGALMGSRIVVVEDITISLQEFHRLYEGAS